MLSELLADKTAKGKEKTVTISNWLIDKKISLDELIAFSSVLKKDADKATCTEAIEFATKKKPSIATGNFCSL